MSRALDAETIASLQENSTSVYTDIVKALRTKTPELLEIEFLSKSHPLPDGSHAIVEGNSIAIPKIRLVQAFLVARQVLFTYLSNPQSPGKHEEQLRDATAVMLLMDPEHLTAANTRKRIIQKHPSRMRDEIQAVLRDELYFVDSYLTSRLHRHTKSPTLWSHRRWVLKMSKSIQMEHDVKRDLKSVVLVAAERHPRNYYAFCHMRWLLTNILGQDSTDGQIDAVVVLKEWSLRHPSDTSGFSALLFCLLRENPLDTRSPSEKSTERSSVCKEVLKLTLSYKWTNESAWVFLRTMHMVEGASISDVLGFYEAMKNIIAYSPKEKPITAVKAAIDWCAQNNQHCGT